MRFPDSYYRYKELFLYNSYMARIRGRFLRADPLFRQVHAEISPATVDRMMNCSVAHKFVYVRFPKVANSTLIRRLACNDPAIRDAETISGTRLKSEIYPHPSMLPKRERREIASNYFYFCFSRNPYDRVLSAFRNKVEDPASPLRRRVEHGLEKKQGEVISLDEFLTYLDQGGLGMDVHWIPQAWLSPVPASRYNFIGRFENLDKDSQALLGMLFPRLATPKEVSVVDHQTRSEFGNSSYCTAENAAKIERLYAEDFAMFGYSML